MKATQLFTLSIAVLAFGLVSVQPAAAQLRWRVSIKIILDANGNRPTSGNYNTPAEIQSEFDLYNTLLDGMGRGYRFQVTEIVELSGVSQWFNRQARSSQNKADLETAAKASPATYAWRNNAINVYVNNTSSGWCSRPGSGDIIFVGANGYQTLIIHEIGHFLDLCHTQGCECGGCSEASNPPTCSTVPGDDDLADTLPDLACWDRDDISQWSYSRNYSQLSSSQQNRVDDVWFNIMSYHTGGPPDRLTRDQWDRMTDASNGSRSNVATGRTRFVDDNANPIFQFGSSVFPFDRVAEGIGAANSGDIVLVRSGTYDESLTITKAVTLRATRGSATIR